MNTFHVILITNQEIIIQEVRNHNSLSSIINFMSDNFGSNNFFIYESGNWFTKFYQILKGKVKQFGKNEYLNENPGLLYLYDNYNVLFNNTKIFDVIDKSSLDLIQIDFNQLKYDYGFKAVTIDNWKYKLTASEMFITFSIDPTQNKKYVNWINKLKYIHGILNEDESKIKDLLIDFDKPEVKNLIKKAGYDLDINSYETDKDLFSIIDKCYYSKLSELELKDTFKLIEVRTVFEDINWWVVVPENHNESVKLSRYGGMTYWCTAADSEDSRMYYHNYTVDSEGNFHKLYIFINKNDPSKKYQWSELEGDFLDWNDDNFNIGKTFDLDFISKFTISNNIIPWGFKAILIKNDKFLDKFIYDDDNSIRYRIAEKGYRLDILVYDKEYIVKKSVVEQGYGLDILINDEDYMIRRLVAEQGYGLDILISDENEYVRKTVAEQGYGLDILRNDKIWDVSVAAYGKSYNNS